MDIRRALTFAVADASWASKGGLGAAISLVPILNVAAIGYGSRVARRVAGGQDSDLPTWDDLGALFREGTPLALAQSLYTLPLAGLLCLPLFSAWLLLPTSGEVEALRDRTPALLLLCGAGLALFLVGWLLLSAISPAIMANYVRVGGFASCFDVPALARLISVASRPLNSGSVRKSFRRRVSATSTRQGRWRSRPTSSSTASRMAEAASAPSRQARILSNAVGIPPRWRWPSTAVRTSNSPLLSSSRSLRRKSAV